MFVYYNTTIYKPNGIEGRSKLAQTKKLEVGGWELMMFSFMRIHEKQIFIGNLFFIVCCVFYLAWWLLAFKPTGAIAGMKTGWLLIPASIAGLYGVIQILRGILTETQASLLLPGGYILWGGIAVFAILLPVTVSLFKRPVTSELILIVGWGMLALAEINSLFGTGLFSNKLSVGFFMLILICVVVSLVCYILYYRLGSRAGYIDGMVPLILAAMVMAAISFFMRYM